jgi:hypothetical protein
MTPEALLAKHDIHLESTARETWALAAASSDWDALGTAMRKETRRRAAVNEGAAA